MMVRAADDVSVLASRAGNRAARQIWVSRPRARVRESIRRVSRWFNERGTSRLHFACRMPVRPPPTGSRWRKI